MCVIDRAMHRNYEIKNDIYFKIMREKKREKYCLSIDTFAVTSNIYRFQSIDIFRNLKIGWIIKDVFSKKKKKKNGLHNASL